MASVPRSTALLARIDAQKQRHRSHGRWARGAAEWSRHGLGTDGDGRFVAFVKESFKRLGQLDANGEELTGPPGSAAAYETSDAFAARCQTDSIDATNLRCIPRLRGESLTPAQFHTLLEQPRLPCIISGLARDWPMRHWTVDTLSAADHPYSQVRFKVDEQRSDAAATADDEAATEQSVDTDPAAKDEADAIDALQSDSFKLPLQEFMHYLHHNTDDAPLYVFDAVFDCDPVGRQILDEFTVPPHFDGVLFALLGEVRRPPYRWILIGPARSGSALHTDPLATSAWNTCIDGVKMWVLFPPHVRRADVKGAHLVSPSFRVDHSTGASIDPASLADDDVADAMEAVHYFTHSLPQLRASPKADELGMIEFLQYPGETVFVPHGWLHAVINLTPTLAVTQNYVSPRNFAAAYRLARSTRPHLAQRWREQLRRHDPDLDALAARIDTEPSLASLPPFVRRPDRRPSCDYAQAMHDADSWYWNPSSSDDDEDEDADEPTDTSYA